MRKRKKLILTATIILVLKENIRTTFSTPTQTPTQPQTKRKQTEKQKTLLEAILVSTYTILLSCVCPSANMQRKAKQQTFFKFQTLSL